MKIAVIGATGFVGTHIVNELLSRNHRVLGISRNKQTHNVAATYISLDIFNTSELAVALRNNDVVVSAFNPGWQNKTTIYDKFLCGAHLYSRL